MSQPNVEVKYKSMSPATCKLVLERPRIQLICFKLGTYNLYALGWGGALKLCMTIIV